MLKMKTINKITSGLAGLVLAFGGVEGNVAYAGDAESLFGGIVQGLGGGLSSSAKDVFDYRKAKVLEGVGAGLSAIGEQGAVRDSASQINVNVNSSQPQNYPQQVQRHVQIPTNVIRSEVGKYYPAQGYNWANNSENDLNVVPIAKKDLQCSTEYNDLVRLDREKNPYIGFFSCTKESDLNNDSRRELEEFLGTEKEMFSLSEDSIMLCFLNQSSREGRVTFRAFNEEGILIGEIHDFYKPHAGKILRKKTSVTMPLERSQDPDKDVTRVSNILGITTPGKYTLTATLDSGETLRFDRTFLP
jgi:hypothetical protein